jgi:putative transposase
MVWKGYRSRLHKCNDFNAYGRNDEPLRARLVELAREKPRFGYRRLHILLDRSGEHVNHKRVYRVYREAGLTVKRKTRKRLVRVGSPRPLLTAANQEWALDSAHDGMASGRAMRVLSVVDACTRECLTLEVNTSFASRRVTRTLESILAQREKPLAIRCDNGPELTSRHFLAWCIERQIELVHIQPGKPQHNGHVESFHARLRDECLNVSWFENLWDARRKIAAWRKEAQGGQRGTAAQFAGLPDAHRVCAATSSFDWLALRATPAKGTHSQDANVV